MAPSYLPQYKVYTSGNLCVIEKVTNSLPVSVLSIIEDAPSAFLAEYDYIGNDYPEDDRVSLTKYGRGIIKAFPHQIYNGIGEQIGGIGDIRAYFISLGIGQPSGGTGNVQSVNGIEPVNGDITLPLPFVTLTQFDALVSRVTALEQAAGYTQLDTPIVTASSITQTGATISWGAVVNAVGYDIKDSANNLITTVTTLNYTFAGLSQATQYTYYVIAKGSGTYLDSDPGAVSFTTQGVTPPTQPQLKPSFQLKPSTALY